MKYKGYTATAEFDAQGGLFHGELEDITDVVTFQANSVAGLAAEFHAAVDDYLEFCKEEGREPNRPLGQTRASDDPRLAPCGHAQGKK